LQITECYPTKDELQLINEINSVHMDNEFGESILGFGGILVSYDDVTELVKFLKFCRNKLISKNSPTSIDDRYLNIIILLFSGGGWPGGRLKTSFPQQRFFFPFGYPLMPTNDIFYHVNFTILTQFFEIRSDYSSAQKLTLASQAF